MRYERIGGYAYTDDNLVDIDFFNGSRYGDWAAATRFVWLSQFHFLQTHFGNVPFFVPYVFNGVMQCEEFDAFLLGVFYFFGTGRHFVFAAAIYDDGALGS